MSAHRARRVAAAVALATVGLVAAGIVTFAAPRPASGDAPYQTAYWYRLQVNVPTLGFILPPPLLVRDGELFVSGSSASVVGYSALRYAVDGPVPGRLRLGVATGTALGQVIAACRITESWAQGENQAFDNGPGYDCTGGVTGVVSDDGDEVTWDLPATLHRPDAFAIDVALVPAGPTPVNVAFAAPGPGSFTHPPVAAAGEEPVVDPAPPADAPADVPVLPEVPVDVPPVDVPPPGAPAAPATTVAPAAAGGDIAAPVARRAPAPDTTGERVAAGVGLLLLAAAVWWGTAGRGHATASAADGTPVRGIGRFARARAERPRRLG